MVIIIMITQSDVIDIYYSRSIWIVVTYPAVCGKRSLITHLVVVPLMSMKLHVDYLCLWGEMI